MQKIFLSLMMMLFLGCANIALQDTALRHESDEVDLLTKDEFIDRASRSALLVYEGMLAVSEAAKQYALDHDGLLPTGGHRAVRSLLMEQGYINVWPVLPIFAFSDPVQNEVKYSSGYSDMDGKGAYDSVIYVQELKVEVCEEFIHRFSSFGPGDVIYEYEENGNKAPGELFGRHIKIYAISWEKSFSRDFCDVNWVMQYND